MKKKVIIILILLIFLIGTTTAIYYLVNKNKHKSTSNNNIIVNDKETSKEDNKEFDFIIKKVTIKENEKYSIETFIDKTLLEEGFTYAFENEEMSKYKDPGEYSIVIVIKNNDKEYKNEVKLIITKTEEIKKENNTTNTNKKNNTTNNNNNKTNNTNSTDNNKQKYSDNIIVQRALSRVGENGLLCTQLVDYAIGGVGKTLWITESKEVTLYCNHDGLGCVEEGKINDEYLLNGPMFDEQLKDMLGYDTWRLYAKDNKYYKEEHLINGNWIDVTANNDPYSRVGKTVFEKKTSTEKIDILNTENVSKVARQVSLSDLKPGDILHYADNGAGGTHVAIYIGNNEAVNGGYGPNNSVAILPAYASWMSTPTAWRV